LEFILNGLETKGLSFLNELNGDFVLAFWDERSHSLHLAVDRIRIHPLYYRFAPDGLAFSSNLTALLKLPFFSSPTLSPQAIMAMVSLSFIPSPDTIFKEIRKIPPGHYLTYRDGSIRITPYWDIRYTPSHALALPKLQSHTRDLLSQAIALRRPSTQANLQIGTFLSGGIDSSTIAGILSKGSSKPIKCFSIGFDVPGFNEISYARIAAQAYGAEHFEYIVNAEDVYGILPLFVKSLDEPFGNASCIPTYFCARMAKNHGIDILLAGDGGDELFGGNERYVTQKIFDYYFFLPQIIRKHLIEPVIFNALGTLNLKIFSKFAKYVRRANIPYPDRLLSWGITEYTDNHEFWNPAFIEEIQDPFSILDYFQGHYKNAPATSDLDRQLYIDMKLTISDNDIPKVVTMTKAANLAVRFPFLDHHLMDFSAGIPAELKIKGLQLRSFFKHAYRDLLPAEVLKKKKHGFGLPIAHWLRDNHHLQELMHDILGGKRFLERGFITSKGMNTVLEAHRQDNTSLYGTILWNLIVLEMWLDHYER
jgi:asparagine synthase (glutamine-hydrolysing)